MKLAEHASAAQWSLQRLSGWWLPLSYLGGPNSRVDKVLRRKHAVDFGVLWQPFALIPRVSCHPENTLCTA